MGYEVLVRRPERPANMAVWQCLRDAARIDHAFMDGFVEKYAEHFSLVAFQNAVKWSTTSAIAAGRERAAGYACEVRTLLRIKRATPHRETKPANHYGRY